VNIQFIFSYPLWFLLICLIVALLYTAILYYRNKKNEFSRKLIYLLSFLRFSGVFLLIFLLLSPAIKKKFSNEEKPILLVAQDNSESLLSGKDSLFYKNVYPQQLNQLIENLKKDYEVRIYSFGDKVTESIAYSFSGKQTDFESLFDELAVRYTNRNIGALVIASDGMYNKGINPVYAAENINYPIYTIALGDTLVKKDLLIHNVTHNKVVYSGNFFPVEINIMAHKCNGATTKLKIFKNKDLISEQLISITGNNFSKTIILQLEAKEPGRQHYHLTLEAVDNEITISNNHKDIFVEVIDKKQKILILASVPHPDISALTQSIEQAENYEAEVAFISDFNKQTDIYNLIILYQLPSQKFYNLSLLNSIYSSDIPLLIISGEQSNISELNRLKAGTTIPFSKQSTNEALPILNNSFSLFTISNELKNIIPRLPPLNAPFGDYAVSGTSEVLFYQKIGNVVTKKPLIIFNQLSSKKISLIIGEGFWKWRMMNYAIEHNHNAVDELINKTIQYLSLKADKRFFRILVKSNYYENEPLEINAELYNESYELINQPEVEFNIINKENKKYAFVVSKAANAYSLNAGYFPVGEYSDEAKVSYGGKILTEKGAVMVAPILIEYLQTVADHQLLNLLARKHDGIMIIPGEINKLPGILKEREDIKPVIYQQHKLTDMINLPLLFLLIIMLLSLEWFLRKWSGNY